MNEKVKHHKSIGNTVFLLPHMGKGDVQHAPFWWCRKRGMIHGQDFIRETTPDGLIYAFPDPAIATAFALRWIF